MTTLFVSVVAASFANTEPGLGKYDHPCASVYSAMAAGDTCFEGDYVIEVTVGNNRKLISAHLVSVSAEQLRGLAQCAVEHIEFYAIGPRYKRDVPGTREVSTHVFPPNRCR